MDPIQHDPRTKQQIKNMLFDYLYAPVFAQFKKRIRNLVTENTIVTKGAHRSFVYKGVVYNEDDTHPPMRKARLHPSLVPSMEEYLHDLKDVNEREVPFVLGFIIQVLNSSEGLTDYFQVLPDVIHPPLHRLMSTCPCKDSRLSAEKAAELREGNKEAIFLMKRRLVQNLLI